MSKEKFPWLALGLGLVLALVLIQSGAVAGEPPYKLPLLTLLIMGEFGFIVTAIGAGLGVQSALNKGANVYLVSASIGCAALSLGFLLLGLQLWPGMGGG